MRGRDAIPPGEGNHPDVCQPPHRAPPAARAYKSPPECRSKAHDAWGSTGSPGGGPPGWVTAISASASSASRWRRPPTCRSEEHTSELQSRLHLVCRLLLEKKKKKQ